MKNLIKDHGYKAFTIATLIIAYSAAMFIGGMEYQKGHQVDKVQVVNVPVVQAAVAVPKVSGR